MGMEFNANAEAFESLRPEVKRGLITRCRLLKQICPEGKQVTFVRAPAGYGKTTLINQFIELTDDVACYRCEPRCTFPMLIEGMANEINSVIPDCSSPLAECMHFEGKPVLVDYIAKDLLKICGRAKKRIILVFEDVENLCDTNAVETLIKLAVNIPENIKIVFTGSTDMWSGLAPLAQDGRLNLIDGEELLMDAEELGALLGGNEENIASAGKGRAIAARVCRLILESGGELRPAEFDPDADDRLFHEVFKRLEPDIKSFLVKTACFTSADPEMIDSVLGMRGSALTLASLENRNIFTSGNEKGAYEFYAPFRGYLLALNEAAQKERSMMAAADYYFKRGDYVKAAVYAVELGDCDMLRRCLFENGQYMLQTGQYDLAGKWLAILERHETEETGENGYVNVFIHKAAFLCALGRYAEAAPIIDRILPRIMPEDTESYYTVRLLKARVVRHISGMKASNRVLDEYISSVSETAGPLRHTLVCDRIFNLCWDNGALEAHALCKRMLGESEKENDETGIIWYSMLMSMTCFIMGNMRECVRYYEIGRPHIGGRLFRAVYANAISMCAAKAYHVLEENSSAMEIVNKTIKDIRIQGYVDNSAICYFIYGDIMASNAAISMRRGMIFDFSIAEEAFSKAIEYTQMQNMRWSDPDFVGAMVATYSDVNYHKHMSLNIYHGMTEENLELSMFRQMFVCRLCANCYRTGDLERAWEYAETCQGYARKTGNELAMALCDGIKARICLDTGRGREKEQEKGSDGEGSGETARRYIRSFLARCEKNGIYSYFRDSDIYGDLLVYAGENNILAEFADKMISLSHYKYKKLYVGTFGGFKTAFVKRRGEAVKAMTNKTCEMLILLLESGAEGINKERVFSEIWADADSVNPTKLFHVTLAHLKSALKRFGVANAIMFENGAYSINREEIEYDVEVFELAYDDFTDDPTPERAEAVIRVYSGEFMAGHRGGFMAESRERIRSKYEDVLDYCALYKERFNVDILSRLDRIPT